MKVPQFIRRAVARAKEWWRRPASPAPTDRPIDPPTAPADGRPAGVAFHRPPPLVPSSVPTILLAMINRERGMRGVPRCDHDVRLTTAAEGHCDGMADAGRCEHVLAGGPCAEDRVLLAGYAFSRLREAIAAGQGTALEVVRDWLNDPTARQVLLDPGVRHAGFGLAVAGDGRHYWTALFAAPPGGGVEAESPSSVNLSPPVVRGGS